MRRCLTKFPVIATVFLLLGLMVFAGADGDDADGGASVVGVIKFDGPRPNANRLR